MMATGPSPRKSASSHPICLVLSDFANCSEHCASSAKDKNRTNHGRDTLAMLDFYGNLDVSDFCPVSLFSGNREDKRQYTKDHQNHT
jgi:hypothetical protein